MISTRQGPDAWVVLSIVLGAAVVLPGVIALAVTLSAVALNLFN